jgi:hypothetical protein
MGGRRTILKHIGNALLVQHRVCGLVAIVVEIAIGGLQLLMR